MMVVWRPRSGGAAPSSTSSCRRQRRVWSIVPTKLGSWKSAVFDWQVSAVVLDIGPAAGERSGAITVPARAAQGQIVWTIVAMNGCPLTPGGAKTWRRSTTVSVGEAAFPLIVSLSLTWTVQ
jgi:hypothetical protein